MKLAPVATEYTRYTRQTLASAEAEEQDRVDALAQSLRAHLDARDEAITTVHTHGAQSSAVQAIVSELLRSTLGFGEEVVLPPQLGFVTAARADFYFSLGEGRGVIAGVERGGTTTKNHDLKDLWKAHIAPNAHHLFLVVPNTNWSPSGTPREKPFPLVARRLGAFFGDARREIDVQNVHVFGYGASSLRNM